MKTLMNSIILLVLLQLCTCFNYRNLKISNSFFNSLRMSTDTVIIGLSGGIAENIGLKLLDLGYNSKITTILDRLPTSPILNQNRLIDIFTGDITTELIPMIQGSRLNEESIKKLLSNKLVILCDDNTVEIDEKTNSNNLFLLDKVSRIIPKEIKSLVLSSSVNTDSNNDGLLNIFSAKGFKYYKKWCQDNNIPFSAMRYGKLTGGVIGNEPMPFLGLPLIEPELHPSYVLRSIVLSDISANKYASTEICTRLSLSEAISRLIIKQQTDQSLSNLDALVVSIAGDPPSEKDWNQLFNRVIPSENAELLRIEFSTVTKPDVFINWIVDVWFPQALVDADAATLLTGARPVRATKSSTNKYSVDIRWDAIKEDLSIVNVGGLEIQLNLSNPMNNNPYLSVYRKADKPLPAESQLIDKLIEGINKVVYKKGYCTPVNDSSSKVN